MDYTKTATVELVKVENDDCKNCIFYPILQNRKPGSFTCDEITGMLSLAACNEGEIYRLKD